MRSAYSNTTSWSWGVSLLNRTASACRDPSNNETLHIASNVDLLSALDVVLISPWWYGYYFCFLLWLIWLLFFANVNLHGCYYLQPWLWLLFFSMTHVIQCPHALFRNPQKISLSYRIKKIFYVHPKWIGNEAVSHILRFLAEIHTFHIL